MVITDFFGLDEKEYAQRISQYDTQRLVKQEIMKLRQQYAAACSIGTGLGGAFFTAGASLVISGYGARRNYVAKKKMALIQAELNKRNVTLHEQTKRDMLIPFGASVVGLGIGLGLDEVASHITNTVADGLQAPSGSSTVQAVLQNSGDALQGVQSGVTEQAREVVFSVSGIGDGVVPGSDLSQQILSQSTTWVAAPNAAQAVGFHAGMLLGQGIEKAAIVAACQTCAWSIMEAFESRRKVGYGTACKRLLGPGTISCNECSQSVSATQYWHCCQCSDDFDLCTSCYKSGKRCSSSSHTIKNLQNVVESRYVTDTQVPRYQYLKGNPGNSITKERIGSTVGFICTNCTTSVCQGLWYYCDECPEHDLCQKCYLAGNGCLNKDHTLRLQVCAFDCSENPGIVSDCHRPFPTRLTCDNCESTIVQGRYYHCCNCANDNFDICESCCLSGAKCSKPNQHMLQARYVGAMGPWSASPEKCSRKGWSMQRIRDEASCDRCLGELTTGYSYHCCGCNDDDFDLCTACYAKGKGCNDPTHMMTVYSHR